MDAGTRAEIDKVIWQTLKDAGLTEPPVDIEDVLRHLEVYRDFYDLQDPKLLERFWYKVRIFGGHLIRVVKKIRLAALWLPEERRIMVDAALPDPKKEWASFHDSVHRILEWHRPFYLGDTAQTLDPDYQELLEEEANYGASGLMFCGPLFSREALDTRPEWSSVAALKKRYRKSWVTTLRRYVEHSHARPMLMVVSTPRWLKKPDDQVGRCRHFVGSSQFAERFRTVTSQEVLFSIDDNISKRRGGMVGSFVVPMRDQAGMMHEFVAESFFNTHYVLTLLVHLQPSNTRSFVLKG